MADTVTLTPNQRRTARARAAFDRQFATPEAKSAHFREIGRRGNAGRLTLSAEQAAALSEAYRLLSTIADRLPDPSEIA